MPQGPVTDWKKGLVPGSEVTVKSDMGQKPARLCLAIASGLQSSLHFLRRAWGPGPHKGFSPESQTFRTKCCSHSNGLDLAFGEGPAVRSLLSEQA
ncbi:unnamed protein product [Caretta caretta]